eukprot:RCo050557
MGCNLCHTSTEDDKWFDVSRGRTQVKQRPSKGSKTSGKSRPGHSRDKPRTSASASSKKKVNSSGSTVRDRSRCVLAPDESRSPSTAPASRKKNAVVVPNVLDYPAQAGFSSSGTSLGAAAELPGVVSPVPAAVALPKRSSGPMKGAPAAAAAASPLTPVVRSVGWALPPAASHHSSSGGTAVPSS